MVIQRYRQTDSHIANPRGSEDLCGQDDSCFGGGGVTPGIDVRRVMRLPMPHLLRCGVPAPTVDKHEQHFKTQMQAREHTLP